MAKKLSLEGINQAIESKRDTYEVTIVDYVDNDWVIKFDNEFSGMGISNVVVKYAEFINSVNGNHFDNNIYASYLFILLMKEFTDMRDFIPNDVEGQIKVLKKLVEIGIFTLIIEGFKDEELKKLSDAIIGATDNIYKNLDELKKESEKVELGKSVEEYLALG